MLGKLAEIYFTPRFWERRGKLYELFGIRIFKKYLPISGDLMMRKVFRGKMLENGHTETLENYERFTRVCECIHLVFFFVYLSALFSHGHVITVVVSNLLVNVYPIMLQRYNRARLYRILERRRSRVTPIPTKQPELKAA
ncbi:hypothetical protein KKH05_00090 [Patescibacteria group bacterium]|nr:hypothetical protein [Patescibacteria group bacterium]